MSSDPAARHGSARHGGAGLAWERRGCRRQGLSSWPLERSEISAIASPSGYLPCQVGLPAEPPDGWLALFT